MPRASDPGGLPAPLACPQLDRLSQHGRQPSQPGRVGNGLTATNVFQWLKNFKIHWLWSGVGMWFLIPLVKILSEFVSPGKGLFVAVEQVLLIWQVAELIGGAHLELVVLERCEEEGAVLQHSNNVSITPRINNYLWLISRKTRIPITAPAVPVPTCIE